MQKNNFKEYIQMLVRCQCRVVNMTKTDQIFSKQNLVTKVSNPTREMAACNVHEYVRPKDIVHFNKYAHGMWFAVVKNNSIL